MTRNLKALGLTLMAACAMGAVLAAGAQANNGTIEADVDAPGEVTVTGVQIAHEGSNHHKFETAVGRITCEETIFEGTVADEDHELTITPTYNTCTTLPITGGSFTTTVNMTQCDYLFTGGNATPGEPNHFEGITVSLTCPNAGEAVHIKVYNSQVHGVGHSDANRRCEYTVDPFSPHKLHNTAVNNLAPEDDDVEVTSEVTDIAITRTFGTFLQCGAANQTSDYTGGTTLRAYSDTPHSAGNQVDLTLTDVG